MTNDRPINIMLVEDYELTRKGVRGLLETSPSFRVVSEAADMEEALRKAQDNSVDRLMHRTWS